MTVDEFLSKVAESPALEVVHRDPTMIILRRHAEGRSRTLRIGLWAIRRVQWEQLSEAWGLARDTKPSQDTDVAMTNRSEAPNNS